MEIQRAKNYLKIDYDEDDTLILGFIVAAKEYLRNAGVPEQTNSELYNIVALMLVALFYEHRDTAGDKVEVPGIVNNFIVQLSIRGDINGSG